ncbi:MAG: alanine-tRNA synthetase second additional domain-containing protein [bacterium]|nr:alanine-tRNA synthetase second additional domain-containing protein [bacterium]
MGDILNRKAKNGIKKFGEHVSSTGEIGTFRITTTSYADGQLRIRFKLSRPLAAQR